jgi:GTP cyclohydrolase II
MLWVKAARSAKGPSLNPNILSQVRIPLLGGLVEADLFAFAGLADAKEHIALGLGEWRQTPSPLVRLHSECLTGDVFGSAKCDCGPQLREALQRCAVEGGLVLYMRQEGRGIGLYNKLAAYALQEGGLDTFEANHAMNFPDDLRDYAPAAQMLQALGVKSVRLLSNNPEKTRQLEKWGVVVEERVSTGVFANVHNARYLHSKALKSGHHLALNELEAYLMAENKLAANGLKKPRKP